MLTICTWQTEEQRFMRKEIFMYSTNKRIFFGLILMGGLVLVPLFSQGWGRGDRHRGWDNDRYSDRAAIWQEDLEGKVSFVRNDLILTVGNQEYFLNIRDRSVLDTLDSGMTVKVSGYEYQGRDDSYGLDAQSVTVNDTVYILSRGSGGRKSSRYSDQSCCY